MKKENLWYIIMLPIIAVILFILTAIDMADTQFKQFEGVETESVPAPDAGQ